MVTTVVPESRPAFVALAGPTASGKTAAALAVARRWPVEIVSVDSALVYRGMDLGTAKPTAAERAAVPHHLIDIRDAAQAYSAAEFARDAARLVHEIRARGALPLLVGGTMLYFKALFEGLADMPAANPAVRAALEAEAARVGWPAMHARLAEVDPVTAARLAPNDAQRIQRALEVWQVSGQPLSAWHARGAGPEPGPQTPSGSTPRPSRDLSAGRETNAAEGPLRPALFLSLEPADRGWLHARIAQRFDEMLRAGFLEEVSALRARGDLSPTLPSLRSVGYRQAWEWLDHAQAGAPQPLNLLRERGIAATRQLAKRQITWLRSMPWRQVIAADAPDASSQVIAAIDAARNALGLAAPAQPPSPIPGERR